MTTKHKAAAETGGRTEQERKSIRRQLKWMGGLLGLGIVSMLVLHWGQSTGWGNPDRAVKDRFTKGEADFVAGRFDLAAQQYQEVVDRYPQHPQVDQALTQLSSAYQGMGKLDLALDALQKLVVRLEAANDRSDLHAYTLLQIGKMQKDNGDYVDALVSLNRVRNEHPKTDWSGEALNTIGQVYEAQKKFPEARGCFTQLIKELPGGFLAAEAQSGIGECYEGEGQPRKALKAYQLVLDKYPSAVWETAKAHIDSLKKDLANKSSAKS
jgi:tetratricopeptide (TPR) repeat protein